MPTYEYQCGKCETVFDVFQSIKASPLKKAECPKCGTARPVKRLIGTGGAVIFKGSGFYQTDYRSEGYKTAAKADSGDSSTKSAESKSSETKAGDSKSGESKSSESKPAAKTEKPAAKSDGPTGKSDNGGSRASKSAKKK